MGINQYVGSVDDEKTSAPAGQGETQPGRAGLHGDLHKKIQRCRLVGLLHVRGDVLMAGGEGVSCSFLPPGPSLLCDAPQPTQH